MYTNNQIQILNNIKDRHKKEISNHHKYFQTLSKLKDIVKNYDMSVDYNFCLSIHYNANKVTQSILYDVWAIWEEIDDIIKCDDYKFIRNDENKYMCIDGLKNGKKEITFYYNFNSVSDCKVIYEEVTETRTIARVVCD